MAIGPDEGWPAICLVLALVAFAGNSILCRMALGPGSIDAATFSTIRFAAGAVMLLLITRSAGRRDARIRGSWVSALWMFLYAVPFSFAYTLLSAGTGALVLFGSVQITMMLAALRSGERPRARQWFGLALALAGLLYLVSPGLASPSPSGAVLMALAGTAWGVYSLRGRGAADPLAETTSNFVRAVPLVVVVSLVMHSRIHMTGAGVFLAVLSGAVTSGLGYVVWYTALKHLTAARASVVQLAVPILAAAGGVLLLNETVSLRLLMSALIVLGGIAIAVTVRTLPADDVLAFPR